MKELTHNNYIELISNGTSFIEKNVELIKRAQSFIILQTYIFEKDIATSPIIDALKQKAKDDVRIYILIDGFGSRNFPEVTIIELEQLGIEIKMFSPPFSRNLDHLGRRLHSKVLIIDGKEALTGGINLSSRFNSPKDSPPWLDFSCYIKGEEVYTLIKKNIPLYSKYFPNFILQNFKNLKPSIIKNECLLKTNINDWMRLKNEIYLSYIDAIQKAKSRIIIVAPYFFPGKRFISELSKASMRGVTVDLIFSADSDHPIERWSSKYLYSWFLNKKMNIYEWGGSIVHGKLALIDDNWVTIGSYNHNFMSRFGNHELNIEINNSEFALIVQNEVDHIKKNSKAFTLTTWENQNKFYNKLLETLSFIFANLLTIVSMVLVIRRKDESDFNLL